MPLKNAAKKYPSPFSPPFDPLATSSRIRHRFKVDFGSGEVDSLGIRAVGAWGRCRPIAADQSRPTTTVVALGPTSFMMEHGHIVMFFHLFDLKQFTMFINLVCNNE
jgi:hypothetical protein